MNFAEFYGAVKSRIASRGKAMKQFQYESLREIVTSYLAENGYYIFDEIKLLRVKNDAVIVFFSNHKFTISVEGIEYEWRYNT